MPKPSNIRTGLYHLAFDEALERRQTPMLGAIATAAGSYVAGKAVEYVRERYGRGPTAPAPAIAPIPTGGPTRIEPTVSEGRAGGGRGRHVRWNEETQRWEYCGPRRRRRRLLTASDKADIAFLRGSLGGGELGRAAISAVLSRRQ